jgi:hypothetical protein
MSKSPAIVLSLSLSFLGFLVLPGWFPQALAQDIHVVAGTYGGNCKAPCGNVTNHLAAACNGRSDCNYKVDYTVIGDPVVT